MSSSLIAELDALRPMTLQQLREVWERRYGAPPPIRSADLLRRMLAWRFQLDALGALDPTLAAALRPKGGVRTKTVTPPPTGASVAREWKGEIHEVAVVDGGFQYRGEVFDSLSAIARKITGVRWNGPRFFGLRVDVAP